MEISRAQPVEKPFRQAGQVFKTFQDFENLSIENERNP